MEARGVVVLDFETTGLSPDRGDRAIEIGATRVENGRIVERFASLMNPGRRVSEFIEEYTGITNEMLADAPPIPEVMERFATFMGGDPLVAHNASFDQRFLDAELGRIRRRREQEIACSMLLARRLYPDAPNHKLGTLVRYRNIQTDGVYHRALADAEMTARLWIGMADDLKRRCRKTDVSFDQMRALSRVSKSATVTYLQRLADRSE